jgi:PadR family transcriptional regulator
MTLHTLRVLTELLDDPSGHHFGFELCKQTGLASGTLYPILAKLERAGWVISEWEPGYDPARVERPRRRYYQLSPHGAQRAQAAIRAAQRSLVRGWRPVPGMPQLGGSGA